MFHVIVRPRRIVLAAAIAALLGGAALLSVSPAPAPAAFHECPRGEFCLYFNEDGNGGFYHFAGSNRNLNNDRYVGGDTGETVGDTARFAENNGVPAKRKDVIVYGRRGYRGARDCIEGGKRQGDRGPAPEEVVEQHRVVPLGDACRVREGRNHPAAPRLAVDGRTATPSPQGGPGPSG